MKCPHCGKETDQSKNALDLENQFYWFQQAYPHRQGGQRWPEARRNFARLVRKERVSAFFLEAKAKDYAVFCCSKNIEPQFVMQAATFLGQGGGWQEDWSTETRFDAARRQLQEQP